MDTDRIREAQEIIAAAQIVPDKTIDAIDPPGCGCTECITGLYRPIDQASDKELIAMILGEIPNHSGYGVADFLVQDSGLVMKPRWR